jgi:hypothetical protein
MVRLNVSAPAKLSKMTFVGHFLLLYRDEYETARLRAYVSRDMPLAGSIFCKKNISGTKAPFAAVSDFDLGFTRQVDDILAPRRAMPAVNVIRRSITKDDTISRLEFAGLDFDVIEMRLAVGSGVESGDFHDSTL